jgi:hypothetical protein
MMDIAPRHHLPIQLLHKTIIPPTGTTVSYLQHCCKQGPSRTWNCGFAALFEVNLRFTVTCAFDLLRLRLGTVSALVSRRVSTVDLREVGNGTSILAKCGIARQNARSGRGKNRSGRAFSRPWRVEVRDLEGRLSIWLEVKEKSPAGRQGIFHLPILAFHWLRSGFPARHVLEHFGSEP